MVLCLFSALIAASPAYSQLTRGSQFIAARGVQIEGLCQFDDYFHLDTYSNDNYSCINWGFTSNPAWMGTPPGFPWARWASGPTNMPPQNGEDAYMSQLISVQLGDEWNIDDDTTRTTLVNWFTSARTNFPNTLLYHNNYGGQASDSALGDFITRAQPDLLSFDEYPFLSDYNSGTPIPGPFTDWYSELRRYRAWSMSTGLPFGIYRQTFHSVEDYDQRIYRVPSTSEMRLNTFVGLAFDAKALIDFTYNSGATTLFDIETNGYSGDLHTNADYIEQMDINRRAWNLGKALACLTPVYEEHNTNDVSPPPGPGSTDPNFPDGTVTGIMILRGRTVSGGVTNATPMPNSFVIDPQEQTNPANQAQLMYSWWESNINDPYLRGWSVTNKAGIVNYGLPGDVFIAWFHPIDESFDGSKYTNEVYMMVVNGLSDPAGTAADCLQEIKLNFAFPGGITAVNMLDPETGNVTTNTLPIVNTRNQLVLDLNGGDAALFKFSDGAPFVGRIMPQAPKLSIQAQGATNAFTVQGTQGARYAVQTASSLAGGWNNVTNLVFTSTNLVFLDNVLSNACFYRVVGTY